MSIKEKIVAKSSCSNIIFHLKIGNLSIYQIPKFLIQLFMYLLNKYDLSQNKKSNDICIIIL